MENYCRWMDKNSSRGARGPKKLKKRVKYYPGCLLGHTLPKKMERRGTFDQQNRKRMVHFCLFSVAFFFVLFFYYAASLNRDHSVAMHPPAVPAH